MTLFVDKNLQDIARCAIYTKQSDDTFLQCENFAFTPLSEGQQIDKNIPFFVPEDSQQLLICRFHHSLLLNTSNLSNIKSEDLNNYSNQSNSQNEEKEFIEEFSNFIKEKMAEKQINLFNKSDDYLKFQTFSKNLLEQYRAFRKQKSEDGEQLEGTHSTKKAFDALSMTALRRYKKFFKLPNKSGAISKQQLLDGISEHFDSVLADPNEVVANFMFTVNHRLNRLDNPSSGESNK